MKTQHRQNRKKEKKEGRKEGKKKFSYAFVCFGCSDSETHMYVWRISHHDES